jgi:OOP family OmpA-OmpF porin
MKRIICFVFCLAFCSAIGFTAWAVEIDTAAVQAKQVPASYATVKDGNVVFGKAPTAYSPDQIDAILAAYGGSFQEGAKVPASFAKGKAATAYSPDQTHEILTAYGFSTTPEAISQLRDPTGYATVKDGNIVFGKSSTAYSPEEFNMLMAAYRLPVAPVVVAPAPFVAPPPPAPPAKCIDADEDGVCDDVDQCLGTPKGAKVDERGCWVIDTKYFDFDKAELKPMYYGSLDAVVNVMKANPDLKVQLDGHTCDLGKAQYNQKLSERRAKAVLDYLVNNGIDPQRLSWQGYGETQPAYPNTSEENRAKNRRVELTPSAN